MAGQETQYISDILKEFYTPVIVNQMYKKSPTWALLKKKTAPYAGKRIVIPVRTAFTEAVGALAANNYTLMTAQRNTYDQAWITMKRNYGRVMVDGFAIEAAKGKGGWIDVLQGEIEGNLDAFALDVDRQLMADGSGRLGTVLAVSATGATQTFTITGAAGLSDDVNPSAVKWFRAGQVVDFYRSGTLVGYAQLTSVTPSTVTVIAGAMSAGAPAPSDVVYKHSTYEGTSSNGEMIGLEGLIGAGNLLSSGLFENIDATAEVTWQSQVFALGSLSRATGTNKPSSTCLSEADIQTDLDAIDNYSAGEPVDIAITTKALRNKLIADQKLAYRTEILELNAGWKAIKYTGGDVELPIMGIKNCPTGRIYYLSQPHLTLYVLKALQWDDKLGGVIKGIAGMDAYEAWFKIYANMGTNCRNSMGKSYGYTLV